MNKLFFILLILLPLTLFASNTQKIYKVAIIKSWKPYYFIDEKGKPSGYAIELFEKVANNSNIKYEYIVVPNWKEAHQLIEDKKADIVPNIGITQRREKLFYFTQATDTFEIGLFKKVDSHDIKSKNDLKDKSVSVAIKNVCEKLITKDITDFKLTYNGFYTALGALQDDEVDVMCYPKPLMKQGLKELALFNIVYFGEPLKEIQRGIGVSKENLHLINVFNEAISYMKINGELSKLQYKWFESHGDIELSYEQLITIIFVSILMIIIVVFFVIRSRWLLTKTQLKDEIEKQKNEIEKQNRIINTQSKIESLEDVMHNIAHQWRQPLAIVVMSVNNVKLSIALGEKLHDDELLTCVDKVTKQCAFLSTTIDDFTGFVNSSNENFIKINLENIFLKIENSVLESYAKNNIKIIKNIDNLELLTKERTLTHSIVNILNNAKDAMIDNKIVNEDRFLFIDAKKYDNQIKISIKDSAGGIKEDIIDKIFEPYFTTKFSSAGKGMGLYMTYQMMKEYLNYKIEVFNSSYVYKGKSLKGAEFVITITI